MSKLIVEMEMPKSCPCDLIGKCPRAIAMIGYTLCCSAVNTRKRLVEYDECVKNGTRPDWCPIKGVLPDEHGDLVDRDALFLKYKEQYDFIDEEDILNAETIIAAERK